MGFAFVAATRHHAAMRWLRRILGFAAAVPTAAGLGCLASSHFVLLGLLDLNVRISWADRWAAYWHDLLGLGPLLGLVFGIALLVGLPIGALGIRLLPSFRGNRLCGYALAGALAVLAALLTLQAAFGTVPLAGARSWLGLAAQALAGAVGGAVFSVLSGYSSPSVSDSASSAASASGLPSSSSSTTS